MSLKLLFCLIILFLRINVWVRLDRATGKMKKTTFFVNDTAGDRRKHIHVPVNINQWA